MKIRKSIVMIVVICLMGLMATACSNSNDGSKVKIVFADPGWDSVKVHNEIAGIIIRDGFGYKTSVLPGSTPATFEGLRRGDINVYTEVWTDNLIDAYPEAIENKEVIELAINFDDNIQGLWVPTYMIKGDSERGIEPMAPDLKTVHDLEKYWELFKDPEKPQKGRLYGAPPGWGADEIFRGKFDTYGLGETFNYFSPGSDTALSSSIASAYERGQAWLGYYWEPTWILGKYDMTYIEEDPYDEEKWNNGYGSSFPPVPVTVCVHKDIPDLAPDVTEFLTHYTTSSEITNNALAYMQETDSSTIDTAKWFLEEYEELWTTWVSEEIANKVKESLK